MNELIPVIEIHAPETIAIKQIELLGPARAPKISVLNRCVAACRHCEILGCLNGSELTLLEIDTQISELAKRGFNRVTFTPNTVLSQHAFAIPLIARKHGLTPILQLSQAYGLRPYWQTIVTWLRDGADLEAIMSEEWSDLEIELLTRAEEQVAERIKPVVVPFRETRVFDTIAKLPTALKEKLEWLIPAPREENPERMSCDEIRAFASEFANLGISLTTYASLDQVDASLPDWFEINPQITPALETKSLKPRPRLSIIIATWNRKEELINCIRHLQKQTASTDDFEVIVMDDGSTDGTFVRIREHFMRNPSRYNFRYFLLDRPYKRQAGDDLYRITRLRNFAAAKSQGVSLLFLNPEVLVPSDFIADAAGSLESQRAVIYPYFLVPFRKSSQRPRYQDLKSQSFKKIFDPKWNVDSGVAFGVSKSDFVTVGGFARAFHSYGFEDTLLAWQLKKTGIEIGEGKKAIYLLEPPREFSEYSNSIAVKRRISSRSAKIFYAITLEENFYQDFFIQLNRFAKIRSAIALAGRSWLGRLILTPFYNLLDGLRNPEKVRALFRRSSN